MKLVKSWNYLKDKLYKFIAEHNGVSRREINEFMYKYLSNIMDANKLDNKIRHLLDLLKADGSIVNRGTNKKSNWFINKME